MPGCAVCSLDGAAVVVTVLRSGRSSPFWKLSDRVATWMSWMGLMTVRPPKAAAQNIYLQLKSTVSGNGAHVPWRTLY